MTMIQFARKRFVALLFVVGLFAATCGAAFQPTLTRAAPASGEIRTMAIRYYVCADSLTVRSTPGGSIIGTLYRGNTFDEYGREGAWSRGVAFGNVNQTGYVLTQYLC